MDLDLSLGAAGLTLGDIRLRLYAGAGAVRLVLPGGLDLVPASTAVDYTLIGAPEDSGVTYSATYEPPAGPSATISWTGAGEASPTTPPVVIVPFRETARAGDFTSALLRNGAAAGSLAVRELGNISEPGDYAFSGWPRAEAAERWLLRWAIDGASFSRTWRVRPPLAALSPETIFRRLVGTYWLEQWLGPALDERRICPARALGFEDEEISFSAEDAGDVYPWTPAEVRAGAGYALMRFRELDRPALPLVSGSVRRDDGSDQLLTSEYRLYGATVELCVPSKLKGGDTSSILEARRAEVERIFSGVSIPGADPVLSIRNLSRYPTRPRRGTDDGTWRRAYLTVQLEARVRRPLIGPQEVALP